MNVYCTRCYACSAVVYTVGRTVLGTIVCDSFRLADSECHCVYVYGSLSVSVRNVDDDFSESANTSTTQRSKQERIDTFCFVFKCSPQRSSLPMLLCVKCITICYCAG